MAASSFTARRPLLVAGDGRTPDDALDLAVSAAITDGRLLASAPLYFSCLFDNGGKNGPYVADADFEACVHRVLIATGDDARWATIFRAGRPCHLKIGRAGRS